MSSATTVPMEKGTQSQKIAVGVSQNLPSAGTVKSSLSTAKRPRVEPVLELARGAEGVVTRISFLGHPAVRKVRFAKSYRHAALDARLTSRRLAQEARVLLRARRAGVRVPALYSVDQAASSIVMEDVGGLTARDFLRAADFGSAMAALHAAGKAVASLHAADIVHGDLTTSNIIVWIDKNEMGCRNVEQVDVVLIDFGLSMTSETEEDKAVDLYVLERAVIAAHPERAAALNKAFLDSYCSTCRKNSSTAIMLRLNEVRGRGRKRDMTG